MLALQKDRGHAQNSADWLKKNMVNVSGHTGLRAQNAHTQNARKRSGLFRSVPVSARPKIPQHLAARCRTGLHAQNAHTQNARKRSGLFRSVPVSVRSKIPQHLAARCRTGLHAQNAHTQNAHKRSGLFRSVPVCSGFRPPQNSSTSRSPMAHRSARAKRTVAKCIQAFRSVPVSARPKIPQHFAARCPGKRDWNPTSGGCWELCTSLSTCSVSCFFRCTKKWWCKGLPFCQICSSTTRNDDIYV